MKKLTKKIFALALAMGLCFSLCSCNLLGGEEALAYYKDKAKTQIVFENNTYKLLDIEIDDEINVNTYNGGSVVDEGTSDILAIFLSDVMWYNDEKTLIELVDDELNSSYYCRLDVYDEISQIAEKLELDHLCYTTFDDEANPDDHMLENDMALAVEEIVSSQTPRKAEVSSEKFVSIYKCDKNMIFQQAYVDVDLLDNGKCVITGWDEDYNTLVYKIPEEKLKMFEKFVEENYTEFSLF